MKSISRQERTGDTPEQLITPNPHFNTVKKIHVLLKKRGTWKNIKRASEGAQVRVLRGLRGTAAL